VVGTTFLPAVLHNFALGHFVTSEPAARHRL